MSNFSDIMEQLKKFEGSTIQNVNGWENSEGEIFSLEITFTNGDKLEVNPTSYSYGGQNLVVEIS